MLNGSGEAWQSIAERFNAIFWHDSKLKDYQVLYDNDSEAYFSTILLNLKLRMSPYQLREGSEAKSAQMRFFDCRCLRVEMDFLSKAICSNDIFEASCENESEWKHSVRKFQGEDNSDPEFSLDEMLHFKIHLCTPGGDIDILARDFKLEILE